MAAERKKKIVNSPKGWSRGRLEEVPSCPACGNVELNTVTYERHDDAGQMPDIWRMVRCASCESLYLNPRPDEESLPRAYEDYYTHQAEGTEISGSGSSGLVWRMINGYLNHRFGTHRKPYNRLGSGLFSAIEPWRLKLDYFGRHLTQQRYPERGRLLDIGCGNGAFLLRAKDMGWDVVGCEPDCQAVATCRDQRLEVVNGDAFHYELAECSFDAVTMSHVIEHVSDPRLLLQRVFDLLRPGGVLWLALPNPESIGLKTFGAAWRGLHVPYHLCIPSQRVLGGWLTDAGFTPHHCTRRGAHVRRQWAESEAIARRESISLPSKAVLLARRVLTDLLATFSIGSAEESVVIARKPDDEHGS